MLLWIPAAIGCLILIALLIRVRRQIKREKQLEFIENYQFHPTIANKVKQAYPLLSDSQVSMVFTGLRDYFYICNQASGRMVSMPSQVIDVAWHEFILFTQEYQKFCRKSQGRFLHHMPTEAMDAPTQASGGLKRAWFLACKKSGIDPQWPTKLPLLFAIDDLLDIEDGFKYSLDCRRTGNHCATHIGCNTGCHSDSDSSSFFDFGGGSDGGCSGGGGGD